LFEYRTGHNIFTTVEKLNIIARNIRRPRLRRAEQRRWNDLWSASRANRDRLASACVLRGPLCVSSQQDVLNRIFDCSRQQCGPPQSLSQTSN
jgi:hypothetical protein